MCWTHGSCNDDASHTTVMLPCLGVETCEASVILQLVELVLKVNLAPMEMSVHAQAHKHKNCAKSSNCKRLWPHTSYSTLLNFLLKSLFIQAHETPFHPSHTHTQSLTITISPSLPPNFYTSSPVSALLPFCPTHTTHSPAFLRFPRLVPLMFMYNHFFSFHLYATYKSINSKFIHRTIYKCYNKFLKSSTLDLGNETKMKIKSCGND